MEFDTNAVWFETAIWSGMPNFGMGNHALSHAILAVAPLFVPCAGTDLDCDHSFINCSRILIFDLNAGGNGCSDHLWKSMSTNCNILKAAIDLLSQCKICNRSPNYSGGCPNCIHSSKCLKFNEGLHRQSGIELGKAMLHRMEAHFLQSSNKKSRQSDLKIPENEDKNTTPRKKSRRIAMENAKDLIGARARNIVVGRPSWPTDHQGTCGEQSTFNGML